jgi:hypothetical protein
MPLKQTINTKHLTDQVRAILLCAGQKTGIEQKEKK